MSARHQIRMCCRVLASKRKSRATFGSFVGSLLCFSSVVAIWTLAAVIAVREASGAPGLFDDVADGLRPARAEPTPAPTLPPAAEPALHPSSSGSSAPALLKPAPSRPTPRASVKTATSQPRTASVAEKFMDER